MIAGLLAFEDPVRPGVAEALDTCRAARIHVIMVTGDHPATARAVAAAAEKKGLLMLDAPVSGGVGGATAATLTFMVGGSAQAFTRAELILQKMGKTIVHAGGAGLTAPGLAQFAFAPFGLAPETEVVFSVRKLPPGA